MEVYLKGAAVGLAYLAPIGLQNLFVIHSALMHRRSRAFIIAAFVIFFDISLALASFLGAGAVLEALPGIRKAVLLIGGHVLMLMGFKLLKAKVERPDGSSGSSACASLWKSAVAAFTVPWVNPQALIDAALLLGASRAGLPAGSDIFFMAGMASASCLWFLCLTLLVSLLGDRFGPRVLRGVNVVCGAALFIYGASLCLKAAGMMF
ncbi:MAG: LysE family transporter [Mailhella sp.]|nr:LysE family transporter [Mailhella sp.]